MHVFKYLNIGFIYNVSGRLVTYFYRLLYFLYFIRCFFHSFVREYVLYISTDENGKRCSWLWFRLYLQYFFALI